MVLLFKELGMVQPAGKGAVGKGPSTRSRRSRQLSRWYRPSTGTGAAKGCVEVAPVAVAPPTAAKVASRPAQNAAAQRRAAALDRAAGGAKMSGKKAVGAAGAVSGATACSTASIYDVDVTVAADRETSMPSSASHERLAEESARLAALRASRMQQHTEPTTRREVSLGKDTFWDPKAKRWSVRTARAK